MKHAIGAFAIALLLPAGAAGQSADATLTGTIKDPSGAIVPGVTITARNTGTNETRTAVTSPEGLYRVTNLPRGTYEVKAELEGFKTVTQSDVLLTVGDTVRLDFTMEVGALSETVSVTSQASLVNTEEGRISSLVDEKRVAELPLNGRNVFQLIELQPGAVGNPGNAVLGGIGRRQLRVRQRPAQPREQLPARRHRQQRPVHGRPRRRQPERGHDPGVPRLVEQLLRGVRPQQRVGRQRRHQVRHEHGARHRLRVPPQRRARRADGLRRRGRSAQVQPVRRHRRRADHAGTGRSSSRRTRGCA